MTRFLLAYFKIHTIFFAVTAILSFTLMPDLVNFIGSLANFIVGLAVLNHKEVKFEMEEIKNA